MSAVEYKNPAGKSMWQPALEDGQRLWVETVSVSVGSLYQKTWAVKALNTDPWHHRQAFICGHRRALRIAAREQRRIDKARLAVFHEAVSEQ